MDLKALLPVICLWVAIIPWGSGGKDPWAVLVSSFALILAGFFIWRQPRRSGASLLLATATAALFIWGALSLIWTVNRFQSEEWLLYLGLGIVVFSVTSALEAAQKRLLLRGYIWIAAVVGLIGMVIYFTGDYNRLTSIFYWANPAAGFLLPAFLLSIFQFARRLQWQWGILSTFIGTTFFLTDSRGGMLILSVGAVIALVASQQVRKYWTHYLFILAAAFLLSIGFTYIKGHTATAPGSRFAEAALGESQSVKDRLRYWGSTVRIWERYPALGTGAGTYSTIHPQYQSGVTDATSNPHNLYLQVAAELGLIGFLLVLWMVVLTLTGVTRGIKQTPEGGAVALAVLVLLMHFGLEIDSSYPTMIALLFMTVGVVYQPMHHRKLRGVQLASVPAVAILLAAVAISLNFSRVQADKGSIANDNHDYSAAAGYYAKAHSGLAYNPDNWTAEGIDDYALAGITGSKAYLALAKDRANQAVARDPKDSQHYFLRARTERLGGDLNSAITDYENALKLDMYNHPDYYLDLAQTKLQQGDKQAAQAVALRGLSLYSDSVIAQRSADPAIKPAVAGLLVVTSYEQIAQGNMQEAKRALNRALRLDPNNFDAQTLLQQGQDIIKPAN